MLCCKDSCTYKKSKSIHRHPWLCQKESSQTVLPYDQLRRAPFSVDTLINFYYPINKSPLFITYLEEINSRCHTFQVKLCS
jgi:hypothetical protein